MWSLAGAVSIAYLAATPATPDLAAHTFRADLLREHGFVLYNALWYGGHNAVSYSVLYPPLAALTDVRLPGALGTAAAIVLFDRLIPRDRDPLGVATLWFALTAASNLFIGRLPFALGMALGLGALVAIRARPALAVGLGICTVLASPLAALFLLIALVALTAGKRSSAALIAGICVLLAAVVLREAFPEGGFFFFRDEVLVRILAFCVPMFFLFPREERVLRYGVVIYAATSLYAWDTHSEVGQNMERLGTLFGGPMVAYAFWQSRRFVLLAATPLLLWWSWIPIAYDFPLRNGPSASPAYHQPLVDYLSSRDEPPGRIEIPLTRGHWEASHVGRHFPLARGWQRQLDVKYNLLFYRDGLNPENYHRWLREHAVRFVALPDVPLDFSGMREGAIIREGLPYLRPVWRNEHWRVYRLRDPLPMGEGAARVAAMGPDWFDLRVRRPGRALVRLHYTPYWTLPSGSGCVYRAASGWTGLDLRAAGNLRVRASLSISGLRGASEKCG